MHTKRPLRSEILTASWCFGLSAVAASAAAAFGWRSAAVVVGSFGIFMMGYMHALVRMRAACETLGQSLSVAAAALEVVRPNIRADIETMDTLRSVSTGLRAGARQLGVSSKEPCPPQAMQ